MYQINFLCLEDLVPANHEYRKFIKIWSVANTENLLNKIKKDNNNEGFWLLRLFKCLLLQFMENLSDRDLAKYLSENVSGKWLCGFDLTEVTPDYSVFSRVHKKNRN